MLGCTQLHAFSCIPQGWGSSCHASPAQQQCHRAQPQPLQWLQTQISAAHTAIRLISTNRAAAHNSTVGLQHRSHPAPWFSRAWCNTARCGIGWHSRTAQHGSAPHGAAQCGVAQHGKAQHGPAQHGMAQHSMAQHNMAQHSAAAQHGTAQLQVVLSFHQTHARALELPSL